MAPQTWWEENDGSTIHLVTTDSEMKMRAAALMTEPATFTYWTGEKQDAITRMVEAMCQDGQALRFSLVRRKPGLAPFRTEMEDSMISTPEEKYLTRLQAVTANGELLLVTEDRAVQDKALAAGEEIKSFVFWAGEAEEIVNGRVTSVIPTEPFQFTVLAEEATEGP